MTIREIKELLDAEITSRRKLKEQMVGNVYPKILQAEIDQLIRAKRELI
jgi:hypothetical protein